MEHWFDDLTKGLARGSMSRRSMLRSTLKAGLAAAGAALLGRSGISPAVLANGEGQRESPCNIRQEGRTRTLNLVARSTFKGKSVTFEHNVRRMLPREETRISKVFKLGGSLLLQVEAVQSKGPIQITVNYGEAFQGIRRATFSSTDGKVLEGEIDGRRIRPFRVGGDPSSIKFADGGPPPTMKVDSDIPEAIQSVLEQAKQAAANCSAGPTDHAHATSTAALSALQGDQGHGSNPQTSVGCIACEGGCTAGGVTCGVACASGCAASLFFYGLCLAGCLGGCALGVIGCFGGCHASGAPCCPVTCGDVACCDKSETCLDVNRGVCCSKGLIACGAKHCCKPTDTCINGSGFCCPKGQNICNGVCCKSGEVCKDGVACCPPTQVICNGVCCKKGEKCVNGKKCCADTQACGNTCCDEYSKCASPAKSLCCGFTSQVCNGTCCKPGEQCINGKCCSNPCNGVCCSSAQGCQNGKCVSILCPQGQSTCISKDGPDKDGAAICCPSNVACCLGKCCKPGELCCSGPGTPYGCHNPSQCIA